MTPKKPQGKRRGLPQIRTTLPEYERVLYILLIFVTGGSLYLKQFANLRYEFQSSKRMTPEEAEAKGLKVVDVDEVCNEILKEIEEKDLDNWQNIRGPRPWEDSKEFQVQERQKLENS